MLRETLAPGSRRNCGSMGPGGTWMMNFDCPVWRNRATACATGSELAGFEARARQKIELKGLHAARHQKHRAPHRQALEPDFLRQGGRSGLGEPAPGLPLDPLQCDDVGNHASLPGLSAPSYWQAASRSKIYRRSTLTPRRRPPSAPRRQIEPAADDDRVADDDRQGGHVAPDEPAHQARPQDGRILQRRQHGGAGIASARVMRMKQSIDTMPTSAIRPRSKASASSRRRDRGRADEAAAGELPDRQLQPVRRRAICASGSGRARTWSRRTGLAGRPRRTSATRASAR